MAVTLENVSLRPVQRTIETVGTLFPFEQVIECAKVEGRVRKIAHDVGDRVKPGDMLLEVDPTDFELSVRQAQRALEVELAKLGLSEGRRATSTCRNCPSWWKRVRRRGGPKSGSTGCACSSREVRLSKEEMGNANSDARSLEAEYENQMLMAKSGVATMQMKQEALAIVAQQLAIRGSSPRGRRASDPNVEMTYAITSRRAAEGSFVRIGTEVFKLVMDRMLKLKVPVPDRYVGEVKVGQKASVTTAAYDRAFEGTVTRINPAVDQSHADVRGRNPGPQSGRRIQVGQFCQGGHRHAAGRQHADRAARRRRAFRGHHEDFSRGR